MQIDGCEKLACATASIIRVQLSDCLVSHVSGPSFDDLLKAVLDALYDLEIV
jgi:hypothetical protein